MNLQDKLLNQKINTLEQAVIDHHKHPCILKAQKLALAKHDLIKFIKEASKNER